MSKLYLLTQSVNNDYDTYDNCVVCADTAEEAKCISPNEYDWWFKEAWYFKFSDGHIEDEPSGGNTWAHPKDIKAILISETSKNVKKGEVVCSSFNAG